ncbi:MAG: hypothetical protein K9M57_04050 [Phycisphaerae bacterium]|nr:hypothetical protein [Phycisphaerae bacterium]
MIIGILAIISVPMARFFQTLASNIPRNIRVVDTQNNIQLAFNQVAKDMDRGQSLPLSLENINSNENALLIQLPEGTAFYQFANNKIIRRIITPQGTSPGTHKPSDDPIQIEINYSLIKPKKITYDPNTFADPNLLPQLAIPSVTVTPDPNLPHINIDPNEPPDTPITLKPFTIPATGRDRIPFVLSLPGSLASQARPEPNTPIHTDPNTHIQSDPNMYNHTDPNMLPLADPNTLSQNDPNTHIIAPSDNQQPIQPPKIEPVQPPIEETFPGEITHTWDIPDGHITTNFLTENNTPYAVTITSRIEYKFQGVNHNSWKTARLFFLNTPGIFLKNNEITHETTK